MKIKKKIVGFVVVLGGWVPEAAVTCVLRNVRQRTNYSKIANLIQFVDIQDFRYNPSPIRRQQESASD